MFIIIIIVIIIQFIALPLARYFDLVTFRIIWKNTRNLKSSKIVRNITSQFLKKIFTL